MNNEELITRENPEEILLENRLLPEEELEEPKLIEEEDYPETPATNPTHNYQAANKKYVDDSVPAIFGGDGSDGAYTNDTGEINLGGAEVVVKNFSSITIDTQHHMTFSNPHANGTIIIIKCSGNCSIGTGTMIKLGNDSTGGQTGATGGTGGAGNADAAIAGANGLIGTDPTGEWDTENDHGGDFGEGGVNLCGGSGGGGGQVANGSAGTDTGNRGTNGAAGTRQYYFVGFFNRNNQRKTYFVACGSGGGGGAGGSGAYGGTVGNGGDGGRGGGALILEVAGNLTFTGTVTIEAEGFNGKDGDNGGGGGDPRAGGGGGGGAGGTIVVLYKGTLTGSLTTSVIGGTGGVAGVRAAVCTDGNGGNGAAGSYIFEKYIW